jgi:plastocyanin
VNGVVGITRVLTFMFGMSAAICVSAEEISTFKLIAKNGRFYPETIEMPAGQRFRLEITNQNAGPEEFESRELHKELVLAPGVTRTVVFAPLKPGIYSFFGEFHPDTAKGQIVVK